MVLMPEMVMRALQNDLTQHRTSDPFDGAMVLRDDVVEVFALTLSMAGHFDAGFVHPPTLANGVPTEFLRRRNTAASTGTHLDGPAMQSSVVNENTAFPHHFLHMTLAQRIGHIPAHAREHHFKGIVKLFDDLAQGAVD